MGTIIKKYLGNMIDPTFMNIDKLFIDKRYSFDKYYMPLVKFKDFNALICNKPIFDKIVKSKQETCEKFLEMSRNDNYTTGNLLDYLHYENYNQLIGIDLPRQTNTRIFEQTAFIGTSKNY